MHDFCTRMLLVRFTSDPEGDCLRKAGPTRYGVVILYPPEVKRQLATLSDSKLNATKSPKLFATEMNGRRPTPIFATNLVSEERDLALRGFVSPLGSRARQTLMSGSLGR